MTNSCFYFSFLNYHPLESVASLSITRGLQHLCFDHPFKSCGKHELVT